MSGRMRMHPHDANLAAHEEKARAGALPGDLGTRLGLIAQGEALEVHARVDHLDQPFELGQVAH